MNDYNEFNDRIEKITNYLHDILELSETESRYIKSAVSCINETAPSEIHLIFKKWDYVISVSENLAYVLVLLKRQKSKINREYKRLRDPVYTSLVLKGRPSDAARDCEARLKIPELSDIEEQLETIDFIIEYIEHLYKCLDDLRFDLKDRIAMAKIS